MCGSFGLRGLGDFAAGSHGRRVAGGLFGRSAVTAESLTVLTALTVLTCLTACAVHIPVCGKLRRLTVRN